MFTFLSAYLTSFSMDLWISVHELHAHQDQDLPEACNTADCFATAARSAVPNKLAAARLQSRVSAGPQGQTAKRLFKSCWFGGRRPHSQADLDIYIHTHAQHSITTPTTTTPPPPHSHTHTLTRKHARTHTCARTQTTKTHARGMHRTHASTHTESVTYHTPATLFP